MADKHGRCRTDGNAQEGQLVDEFISPQLTRNEAENLYRILDLLDGRTFQATTAGERQAIRARLDAAVANANS